MAALHRLPYNILDPSGKIVASGQTSETTEILLGVEGERFVIRH